MIRKTLCNTVDVVLVLALILVVTSVSAETANVHLFVAGAPPFENTSATRYVKPGAVGGCNSWADACDLQYALGIAESGDQVWVAQGIYYPGVVVTDTFQLKDGVMLYGGFPPDGGDWNKRDWVAYPTILSGDIDQNDITQGGIITTTVNITGTNAFHVVTSELLTTASLDGFTITGGYANSVHHPDSDAGGFYNNNGEITLTHVIFSGNWANYMGGGMYIEDKSILVDVKFINNRANVGGGISINFTGGADLTSVAFNGNEADYSGGGLANDGNVMLMNVTFSSNQAGGLGGGMYNITNGTARLQNASFSSNSAFSGGGMWIYGGPVALNKVSFINNSGVGGGGGLANQGVVTINAAIFSENTSLWDGGGIYNYGSATITNATFSGNVGGTGGGIENVVSSPILTNVTFFGNLATKYGGGIYNWNDTSGDGSHPILTNVILWGNSPDQIYNESISSVTATYSDIQGGLDGEGNIDLDPLLDPIADNGGSTLTHALGEASPAIDAGSPITCPRTDQRYYLRPIDGDDNGTAICDIGAFEYGSVPFIVTSRLLLPVATTSYQGYPCSEVKEISQVECNALIALYDKTGGDEWRNRTNWLVTTTPSDWIGVTVSGGHITDISLNDNLLIGVIPHQLGDLRMLHKLDLGKNQLSGDIPVELGNLPVLEELSLWDNQLNGDIPPELGKLTALVKLYLHNNNLIRGIPPELGNLTNLQVLQLYNNDLVGNIPPELGKLTALQLLGLNSNWLSGNIPPELGNLTSLQRLFLHYNQLSGSIPLSLTNLSQLDYFYFYNTTLCEPNTTEYLAWKNTILDYIGTGVICETIYKWTAFP